MLKKISNIVLLLGTVSNLLYSCAKVSTKISIPEPQVKTDVKITIVEIKNISTNTNLNLGYLMDIIKNRGIQIDFSEYYENSPEKALEDFKEISQKNSSASDTTNNLSNKLEIDLDSLIKGNLKKNIKRFIEKLGKYPCTEKEINIINLSKIEEEVIKHLTNQEIQKFIFTNYTTNTIFETNYYISESDTNKLRVEITEKEIFVSELKVSNEFLWKNIISNYPWVLKVTNGIPFVEGTPSDFSISVFYDIYGKPVSKYSTNVFLSLFVLVSNNTTSNFILFRTNLNVIDFLLSNHKLLHETKPFFYNYKVGKIVIEATPSDCDIYLDGIYLGKGNASEIVPEGLHKVTISRGSFVVEEYIYTEKGKVNFYKKDLLPTFTNTSTIYLDSSPNGASIFVESDYFGVTPTNITLPMGKYRIWLKKGELEKFSYVDINTQKTNLMFNLQRLDDETGYNIIAGLTLLLGTATASSIFLYFWADSQERYYDFLYQKERKEEYYQMKEYYYYFRDNMRTTAIVGTIGTFILWGTSLGIESDKFFVKLSIPF
ncbi:MAG: PEGA domain-containing protein, partial [Brevinematia bacterium]